RVGQRPGPGMRVTDKRAGDNVRVTTRSQNQDTQHNRRTAMSTFFSTPAAALKPQQSIAYTFWKSKLDRSFKSYQCRDRFSEQSLENERNQEYFWLYFDLVLDGTG